MQPRKARQSYDTVAAIVAMTPSMVKTINDFYWGRVRSSLSGMVHPKVTLIGLGEMTVRHWALDNIIGRLAVNTKRWEKESTKDSVIYKAYSKDLQLVEQMKIMVAEEKTQKQVHLLKRTDYDENRTHALGE